MRLHEIALLCLLCSRATAQTGASDTPSAAQQSSEEKHWRRELNGHFSIPSLSITDPFVPTEVSILTGAGYAWVDGPGIDARGNLIGRDSFVAGALAETVSFQAGIFSWWALRLVGTGGLYGGFNPKSALVLGASIPLDVIPGTTVSWQIGRYVRLGGTFDFDYEYARVIDPLAVVQRSLATAQVDTSTVRQRVTTLQVLPGATVAFAPHPAIGLVGTFQYLWLSRDDGLSSVGVSNLVFGIMGQVDLRPLFPKVPLAILAGYRAQKPVGSEERLTQDFEGGLYYSGRRGLVLGVVSRVRWFDIQPGFSTTALIGNAVLRYDWN